MPTTAETDYLFVPKLLRARRLLFYSDMTQNVKSAQICSAALEDVSLAAVVGRLPEELHEALRAEGVELRVAAQFHELLLRCAMDEQVLKRGHVVKEEAEIIKPLYQRN